MPTANSTFAIGGVSCFKDSFVANNTFVFQIKFCGKSLALRLAANHLRQFKNKSLKTEPMKKILILLIATITCNSYSQISSFDEKTNAFITEFLQQKNYSDDFGSSPLLVIDGKPISKETLSQYINLKPEDIDDLNSIGKSSGTGAVIWGENAKDGVLMIKTNIVDYSESLGAQNSKILFILDNIIITKEQAYAIDAGKDIQTVTVYKNSNKFLVMNNEEFDGIIVLVSKVK